MTSLPAPRAPFGTFQVATLTVLFGISGAIALVYEVIWQREFSLQFGASGPAAATVLAAYFFGLGTGSLCASHRGFRRFRPLRLYAALEVLLGLGALLVPLLLDASAKLPFASGHALVGDLPFFDLGRLATAFLVLFLPTFCMGATLPVLGPFLDHGQRRLGISAGWLYVVNTVGASLGTLAFPFLLLPHLGIQGSTFLCALLNLLLAGAALALDSQSEASLSATVEKPSKRQQRSLASLLTAVLSGIATFALQVLWNRGLAQVHENAVHSFALVVFVVILSLAAGAQGARQLLKRGTSPYSLISISWILAGLYVVISPGLFLHLTRGLAGLPFAALDRNGALLLLSGLVLFTPLALTGVALPALFEAEGKTHERDPKSTLSALLGANTLGAVIGALAAGYVVPSTLGLWGGLIACGLLLVFAGLAHWPSIQKGRRTIAVNTLLAALWLAFLPAETALPWSRVTLDLDAGERSLSVTESLHGITAVVERPGSRRLKLNNHYGLGGTASTGDERMQGHIPLLLHPAPKQIAFLGLGTGSTAGAALFHPIEHLTVIELVPDVVKASKAFFSGANRKVLEDARTTIITDDARHFLRTSGQKFDVIIGDLVVPWRQGEGALFTLENFEAARRALRPGGVYCQWVPLYQLKREEWQILISTFLKVFPKAYLWRGDFSPTEPAMALVGGEAMYSFSHDTVAKRLRELEQDPLNPHLQTEEGFWTAFGGVLNAAEQGASNRVNQEDFPWLEILGPVSSDNSDETMAGRTFLTWLEKVPLTTPEITTLPENLRKSAEGGRVLAQMMFALSQGDRDRAEAAQRQLSNLLPNRTLQHLFQPSP